jgi:hypothetical protein
MDHGAGVDASIDFISLAAVVSDSQNARGE